MNIIGIDEVRKNNPHFGPEIRIVSRTFGLLPFALLLGLGAGVFYLLGIMYYVTGRLPDVSAILGSLSGFEQIIEALGR